MKNQVVAIKEAKTRTRFYVVISSDIATGKSLVYNPETGLNVVTPYKDRDAFATKQINNFPYDWMIEFNVDSVKIPENWMNS